MVLSLLEVMWWLLSLLLIALFGISYSIWLDLDWIFEFVYVDTSSFPFISCFSCKYLFPIQGITVIPNGSSILFYIGSLMLKKRNLKTIFWGNLQVDCSFESFSIAFLNLFLIFNVLFERGFLINSWKLSLINLICFSFMIAVPSLISCWTIFGSEKITICEYNSINFYLFPNCIDFEIF